MYQLSLSFYTSPPIMDKGLTKTISYPTEPPVRLSTHRSSYRQAGLLWVLLYLSWWRHQMETVSVLLALCEGNSPVTGEFPTQRPVTRNFDVFFDLRLNKRLSKQSWGWWFQTSSRPLWRHCNDYRFRADTCDLFSHTRLGYFTGNVK